MCRVINIVKVDMVFYFPVSLWGPTWGWDTDGDRHGNAWETPFERIWTMNQLTGDSGFFSEMKRFLYKIDRTALSSTPLLFVHIILILWEFLRAGHHDVVISKAHCGPNTAVTWEGGKQRRTQYCLAGWGRSTAGFTTELKEWDVNYHFHPCPSWEWHNDGG